MNVYGSLSYLTPKSSQNQFFSSISQKTGTPQGLPSVPTRQSEHLLMQKGHNDPTELFNRGFKCTVCTFCNQRALNQNNENKRRRLYLYSYERSMQYVVHAKIENVFQLWAWLSSAIVVEACCVDADVYVDVWSTQLISHANIQR